MLTSRRKSRGRIAETAMSADEVLLRLAEQARADIGTFPDDRRRGAQRARPGQGESCGQAAPPEEHTSGRATACASSSTNAQAALALLGKHQRFVRRTARHSGPGGGPIVVLDLAGLSDDDLARNAR